MKLPLAVVVPFIGGLYSIYVANRLRTMRLSDRVAISRANLSPEQRKRKMRVGAWLAFSGGLFMVAASTFLLWLNNSN